MPPRAWRSRPASSSRSAGCATSRSSPLPPATLRVYTKVYFISMARFSGHVGRSCTADRNPKMDSEWDEAKRLSNIEERGVDFRDAALIFEGIVIAREDKREDYGEQRFRALGRVDDEYYVVAYTRRGSAVRIISAWKVDEDGKKRYEEILSR